MRTTVRVFLIYALLLSSAMPALAQSNTRRMVASGRNAEKIISSESLRSQVEYMTDTCFGGRATGSAGANEAAFWIVRRFQRAGLLPLSGRMSRSFTVTNGPDTLVGHNIMGFMPGQRRTVRESYILVIANYDSHGRINGNVYPGADSNASGVVAMLSIADMFARMKELGRSYGKNMIFIALDGKERNSKGAEILWEEIRSGRLKDPISGETIVAEKIHSAIFLDILGGTLSPTGNRKDYMMMLSGGQYTYDLARANDGPGIGLDISYDYYGSENFTELFHKKLGGQRIFSENNVLCVVFTSGITMQTNKVTDTAESLDYEVLRRRIFLIFHWLERVL